MIKLREMASAIDLFGVDGALKLLASRRVFRAWLPDWSQRLHVRTMKAPVHFRHGTTDKYVIAEVLLRRQYELLRRLPDVRTIVDAGANIGTASLVFLNEYPEARLVAIEPDSSNAEILRQNLSYYGPRAIVLERALWPREEHLAVERGGFRDGGEWSIQVRPAPENNLSVRGITIPALMKDFGFESIDLLKIDIEGAEGPLLEDPSAPLWLPHVRVMAIELHDARCREAFERVVHTCPGTLERSGEVTIWRQT